MKARHLAKCVFALATAGFVFTANSASAFYLSAAGRWLNRDPIEENGGFNLYDYVANNPITMTDRLGFDAGETGEWGFREHRGIQVQVRDIYGNVIGYLTADFHAGGYMEDGRKKEGNVITGAPGYVGITFVPDPSAWPRTLNRQTGCAAQDNKLLNWILRSIGKDEAWFNEQSNYGTQAFISDAPGANGYGTYAILYGNCCNTFADSGYSFYTQNGNGPYQYGGSNIPFSVP